MNIARSDCVTFPRNRRSGMRILSKCLWCISSCGAVLIFGWALLTNDGFLLRLACMLLFASLYTAPGMFNIRGWPRVLLEAIGLTGVFVSFVGKISVFTIGIPLAFILATYLAAAVFSVVVMSTAFIAGLVINVFRRLSSRGKGS